ncbi:hypothetical protein J6590_084262 [Homalodisca vitripennis]|nr:hypothetical protein J6590_084262 [Homalodisca vitripennis]
MPHSSNGRAAFSIIDCISPEGLRTLAHPRTLAHALTALMVGLLFQSSTVSHQRDYGPLPTQVLSLMLT